MVSVSTNCTDSVKYSFKNALGICISDSVMVALSEKLKPRSIASIAGLQISLIADPSNSDAAIISSPSNSNNT